MIRALLIAVFLAIPAAAFAAAPSWNLDPERSHVRFEAVNNGAPVGGEFTDVKADIRFDPEHPETGSIEAVVKTGSVTTDYEDIAETLKTAPWFDVTTYPEAVFKSAAIREVGDHRYEATGMFTLRGVSKEVTLSFTLGGALPDRAHVEGGWVIKRTDYGVGQGGWAATSVVADEVKITLDLEANRLHSGAKP